MQNNHTLLGAWYRTADQQQIFFGANFHDFQILRGNLFMTPVTGHLFSLAYSSGKRTVTDRAAMAEVFVGAMGAGKTTEGPALNHAGEAMSLGGAGNIDAVADLKHVADFDLLANLVL